MDSPSSNLYPANDDSPAREKLLSFRLALLRLHKTLLNMERREYEREHGHVNTGELFRLVIDHAQFAWLDNISVFVVRLGKTLAANEPVKPDYKIVSFPLSLTLVLASTSAPPDHNQILS